MKQRSLGKEGFKVSEIGLGCWQLGGNWGKTIDETGAHDILETAVANGITFFDTADVYGDGRSEQLIGQFLSKTEIPVKVATKFGRGAGIFPDHYTRQNLFDGVEASRKRLGVDQIDLLQLHCIPTEVLRRGEIFDWLRELQSAGKIAHFGVSIESLEEGLLCLEQEGLQSLQVIFNVLRQKLAGTLFPQAQAQGVGIIVRLPLASGLLTGKFNRTTQFQADDHRNFNRDGEAFNVGETFGGLPFEKGLELVDAMQAFRSDDYSLTEFSLRWILDHQAVSTVIPGASSLHHVRGNARVSSLAALPESLHQNLNAFYQREVHEHVRGVY